MRRLIESQEQAIDREAFATDQSFRHATAQNGFEDMAKRIALVESTVAVLRKARVIWHSVFQPQSAKPPVRQVEVRLFA